MPPLPDLSVADVRDWTVDRYYERGEGYYRDGRVHRTRREEQTLKALCRGSRPYPYRIEITLDADGIVSAQCSCPIGGDGRCKHAVATLLTWIQEPDAFEVVDPLSRRLQDQPRERLLAIIRELLARDPSLEPVVELALDRPDSTDPEALQAYVEQAFDVRDLAPYDYGYPEQVAEALDPLLDRGYEHVAEERWAEAACVFRSVAEGVCEQFDSIHDEAGMLVSIVSTCAEGLGEVLSGADEDDLRETVLETLIDIFLWDVREGGLGGADSAAPALRSHTTTAEKRSVADALRDHLPLEQSPPDGPERSRGGWDYDGWKRRRIGGLLLDLERDRLDPEEYLDLCRRTGLWAEYADRLLELDRVDEAVEAARQLPDPQLEDLLDRLVTAGADERALTIAETRLQTSRPSPALRHWLYEHALSAGDPDRALDAARAMFEDYASREAFDRVRTAAEALGRWDEVRDELLETLEAKGRWHSLLDLLLYADEHDRALALVEPFAGPDRSHSFDASSLSTVAAEVEDAHPDAALALLEEAARRLLDRRGRANYADAAELLRRARRLYEREDRLDEWHALLDTLYDEELHRLPAARDEFEKADLLPVDAPS